MSETGIENEDPTPAWLECLAVFGGAFLLASIATVFYLLVIGYVALNGVPL